MDPVGLALIILGCSTAASWLLSGPAARLGLALGLVDLPSSRRTRARPIPTTGGLVIFFTIAVSLVLALTFYSYVEPHVARQLSTLLLGGTVIVLLGMIDDRVNLRPGIKLAVQIAVATAMVSSGISSMGWAPFTKCRGESMWVPVWVPKQTRQVYRPSIS